MIILKTREKTAAENILSEAISKLKAEFDGIVTGSVFVYCKDADAGYSFFCGDTSDDRTAAIERYFSFASSTEISSPEGIADNRIYKSRFITRLETVKNVYLIILSSYGLETFRGKTAQYIISDLLDLQKSLGRLEE